LILLLPTKQYDATTRTVMLPVGEFAVHFAYTSKGKNIAGS
jgi:hypothetical protein